MLIKPLQHGLCDPGYNHDQHSFLYFYATYLVKNDMKKTSIFFIIWIAAYGCYWQNEESLYPENEICDIISVSFAEDIVPILANNCYTCHSNLNAADFAQGITLENYEDVTASANLILGAIKHSEGFPQMPKNRDKLDTCLISKFEAWVNQGSQDN